MLRVIDRSPNYRRNEGFSIVELMVAILIGLIILAGVVQVVISSKTTYLSQEEMSFVQENARYALDVIGKDIQGAGYWGCAGQDLNTAFVATVETSSVDFLGAGAILGFSSNNEADFPEVYGEEIRPVDDAGSTDILPDSFIVRRAGGAPVPVTSHTGTTLNLALDGNPNPFSVGSYVAVVAEDCRRLGVLRASAVEAGSVSYSTATVCGSVKPPLGVNVTCDDPGTPRLYLPGAVAMNYFAHAYYIAESKSLSNQPALKRRVLRNGVGHEEEIALGVEDMEILYGVVDTSGDTQYKNAREISGEDWSNVIAVQVNLVMRSQAESSTVTESSEFLGKTYSDRYTRQLVTSTFRIRNRI